MKQRDVCTEQAVALNFVCVRACHALAFELKYLHLLLLKSMIITISKL